MKLTMILAFVLCAIAAVGQGRSELSYAQKAQLCLMLTGPDWRSDDSVSVVQVSRGAQSISIALSETAATTLVTDNVLDQMTDSVRQWLSTSVSVSFRIAKTGVNLRSLTPRPINLPLQDGRPLVERQHAAESNLYGRNVVLWNSHGYYYEQKLDRWEWQRARLFGTVEDILTSSFVLQFLAPMLENAGANVFLPRERDQQTTCYIADDAHPKTYSASCSPKAKQAGYAPIAKISGTSNPFALGTSQLYDMNQHDSVCYSFANVSRGRYAVYAAYQQSAKNTDRAEYVVHHRYGSTRYVVNQQRGGQMWVYLGTHDFGGEARVVLRGEGQVSADAVRLGGGMGTVERNGKQSEKPSWMEGARYYLQADGYAEAVYSPSNGQNDYTDDINCRGEWVNALKAQKGIDVDMALAFHTDAYTAGLDSTIGTLTIVRTAGKYTDGRSRRVARDIAFGIEEQIAADLRRTWNPTWTTRGIWDKNYSEARRADCPSVLLELLSHQNLNDVRFAQHPQFRFDVCRAVYKALLRAMCGREATVQPLPVNCFGIERAARDSVRLSWKPEMDPLEPTARPTRYAVLVNGVEALVTEQTEVTLCQAANGEAVEYTIVAMNEGGRSFPSQALCAVLNESDKTMLYVDGFDRLAAPAVVKTTTYMGIDETKDAGCAWGEETYHTGKQYDYDPQSEWKDDDCPGLGASYADEEGVAIRGSHLSKRDTVMSLSRKGYSIVSQQKSYFESGADRKKYDRYHIALGAQRTAWYGAMPERHAIYTEAFMDRLTDACRSGAELTLCGAYVGTELKTDEQLAFAAAVLGFRPMTNNASRSRTIVEGNRKWTLPTGLQYGQPDAIEPANTKARTLQRYADSKASAAVEYGKVRVFAY